MNLLRISPENRAKVKLAESKVLLQQHQENAEYHAAMVKMLQQRIHRLEKETINED